MVPAEDKAKRLSSVTYITVTIHHHHHHHHHHQVFYEVIPVVVQQSCRSPNFHRNFLSNKATTTTP